MTSGVNSFSQMVKGVTCLSSLTQKHAFLCNIFFQKRGSMRWEPIKLLLELVFKPRLLHYLYHDVCKLHGLRFIPTYIDATLLLRRFNSSVANISKKQCIEMTRLFSMKWLKWHPLVILVNSSQMVMSFWYLFSIWEGGLFFES